MVVEANIYLPWVFLSSSGHQCELLFLLPHQGFLLKNRQGGGGGWGGDLPLEGVGGTDKGKSQKLVLFNKESQDWACFLSHEQENTHPSFKMCSMTIPTCERVNDFETSLFQKKRKEVGFFLGEKKKRLHFL